MQQHQRVILYILVLVAGAAWTVLTGQSTNAAGTQNTSAPRPGFVAPDFTLKTPEGEVYTLSELHGQAVLVNLWATWCPPCRAEMPAIERMYQEYKDRGFIVLAVNTTSQDDAFGVVPFTQKYGLSFPVLLDETSTVSTLYQLRSLPSSYFIGRDGMIHDVVIGGPMSEALLRTNIERIIQ